MFLNYFCTVSQNTYRIIFCYVTVKYKPISIKIGKPVPKGTLNKIMEKVLTSPKICASTTLGNLR